MTEVARSPIRNPRLALPLAKAAAALPLALPRPVLARMSFAAGPLVIFAGRQMRPAHAL